MKIQHHIVISSAVSSLVYAFFGSLGAAFVSFACGVFIDLDHFFDYFLEHRDINIKNFFNVFEPRPLPLLKKYYLIFHSLEVIFILWWLITKFELGLFWIAAAIGLTQHIIADYFYSHGYMKPYFYFIFVRYLLRFKKEYLFNARPV